MGVLSDLYLCAEADPEPGVKPDFEMPGVTSLHLSLITEILTGQPWDESMDEFQSRAAAEGTLQDGPWLDTLPSALVEALSRIEPSDISGYALHLSDLEDFDERGTGEMAELLTGLATLARRAVSEQKQVVLWSSL
ncbi:MAG: hypothetical protein H7Z41_10070 [Cytophagales bacterium]|nr:hypothetical protein [Armatimonadota bacterium]